MEQNAISFDPSPDALAHVRARGQVLKAIANWTVKRRRFRAPTDTEAMALGLISPGAEVVHDEGLYFVLDVSALRVFTQKELGL